MNRIRRLSPFALVIAGLAMLGGIMIGAHELPRAFAQQGVKDLSAGFQGSLTSAAQSVIVTATTVTNSGTPVISPGTTAAPGFAVANARVHVKHLTLWKAASGTIAIIEHPSTGSDVTIAIVGVIANTPYDVGSGQNSILGINGYLTAAGSSVKVLVNDNTGALTAGTITYSLE